MTFHYTDWFIGTLYWLIIITIKLGSIPSPLSNNQPGALEHCSDEVPDWFGQLSIQSMEGQRDFQTGMVMRCEMNTYSV